MQLTNSVVTTCCNNVLSVTGGDVYISVMTIISSVRQMVETPIYAITEGSSPIISYNYGARRPRKVLRAAVSMALMALVYTLRSGRSFCWHRTSSSPFSAAIPPCRRIPSPP